MMQQIRHVVQQGLNWSAYFKGDLPKAIFQKDLNAVSLNALLN